MQLKIQTCVNSPKLAAENNADWSKTGWVGFWVDFKGFVNLKWRISSGFWADGVLQMLLSFSGAVVQRQLVLVIITCNLYILITSEGLLMKRWFFIISLHLRVIAQYLFDTCYYFVAVASLTLAKSPCCFLLLPSQQLHFKLHFDCSHESWALTECSVGWWLFTPILALRGSGQMRSFQWQNVWSKAFACQRLTLCWTYMLEWHSDGVINLCLPSSEILFWNWHHWQNWYLLSHAYSDFHCMPSIL